MKLRNYIAAGSLLALLALNTGCSSEELIEKNPDIEVPGSNAREVYFNFGGLKLKSDSPQTRAENIATEAETVVDNLVIILAGVDDETHTTDGAAIIYEYRSSWANEPVETDRYKKLSLVQNGNVLTGKLAVDEAVMKPGLVSKKALVLVNGVLINGIATNGNVTPAPVSTLVNLTPNVLYQFCGGTVLGKDLAAEGLGMKLSCDPADITANDIECPLPMSAWVENINFHGSTNVNVSLKRHVSRFDVRNGQSAMLRIGSIRPLKATTGIDFDEANDTRVDMMDQSFLPVPVAADWSDVSAEVVPAFYTFPSALVLNNQNMKFRITAKKLNGETGLWEDKTYTLNLENAEKKPVSIDANTRYVINIAEVTDLNITAVIEIADWQQGGDVDSDLNPTTNSKKTPVMNDVQDSNANKITWTLHDITGIPTALNFGGAQPGQSITFSTPKEMSVDLDDPDADQPRVSIDIFKEEGQNNPGKVWLQASQTVATRAAVGDIVHKLTIGGGDNGVYPVLWVKVKNYYFPEQFVMFRVTALAGDQIVVDMEGDDNPIAPDGWTQDPDTDVFEEGTTTKSVDPIVPGNTVYAVNGYYVTAPDADATKKYKWADDSNANVMDSDPCAGHGDWRMPTMEDFEKMAGWTVTWPWSQTVAADVKEILSDKDVWKAAFPTGTYWSSVARTIDLSACGIFSYDTGTAYYNTYTKTGSYTVRCVQVQ